MQNEISTTAERKKYTRYSVGDKIENITLKERCPGGQKWIYVCDCGKEGKAQISNGVTACPECTRKRIDKERIKHGDNTKTNGPTRLYRIWTGMKTRCFNANNHAYKEYLPLKITMCEEWKNSYPAFKIWAYDNGYEDNLEIDRIDNFGDYTPENCRWATRQEQMKNTRHNHLITINGETMILMDWCRILGLKKTNVYCTAKELGIKADDYIRYKYFNPGKAATKQRIKDFIGESFYERNN